MSGYEILAIVLLALACLAMRWIGFIAASTIPISPKTERMIAAVPPSLLAALLASSAASGDVGGLVAIGAAMLLMLALRNELAAALGAVLIAYLATL